MLVALVIVLLFVFRSKGDSEVPQILAKVNELQSGMTKIETNLKDDFRINREESSNTAKTNREELNKAITEFRNETAEAIRQLFYFLWTIFTLLSHEVFHLSSCTADIFNTFHGLIELSLNLQQEI
jgi:hypothetical protein